MPSDRYYQEIEALTTYFRERVPACGPIVLTDEQRKAGVDSLTGLAADLVKASFTEWLLMRNYELSYNQTCCAFFAALDNSSSPPESQPVGESPRCPKCGLVMCQQFDTTRINERAELATPNGTYVCYTCQPPAQQPAPRVCVKCGHSIGVDAEGLCNHRLAEKGDVQPNLCPCDCEFAPSE